MKKYFIEEDSKKLGPYDVYELKDIGIKATTPICTTDDDEWYNAEEFPELLHILEKNPQKKIDYEKDRFFGYRLAENSDRRSAHLKRRLMTLPFSFLIAAVFIVLDINIKKEGGRTALHLLCEYYNVYNSMECMKLLLSINDALHH